MSKSLWRIKTIFSRNSRIHVIIMKTFHTNCWLCRTSVLPGSLCAKNPVFFFIFFFRIQSFFAATSIFEAVQDTPSCLVFCLILSFKDFFCVMWLISVTTYIVAVYCKVVVARRHKPRGNNSSWFSWPWYFHFNIFQQDELWCLHRFTWSELNLFNIFLNVSWTRNCKKKKKIQSSLFGNR